MSVRLTWQTVLENYETYRDEQTKEPENHTYRLVGQVSIGLSVAVFVNSLTDDNISVLVTALSILIGFAFAAMFPIALESVSGLPRPQFSEDKDDIRVIRQLAVYFRYNVAYFIPLALLCVATLLLQMLEPEIPSFLIQLKNCIKNALSGQWNNFKIAINIIPSALLAFSIFLIQECCYTFYRMCFNALALLRIKEEYVANRPDEP
ncbi:MULTISPECIES: hypothetical protein [Sphingomonas]|uniref:hypothetical protein n=1 Tax=Sphingomonas TaxID=13687 RepID=UPI000AD79075|nr:MULTISPECIES: hypothetical protein [Sphingomonas]